MFSIPLRNGQTFTLDKAVVVEAKMGVGSLDLILEDGLEKRWLLQLRPECTVSMAAGQVTVSAQMHIHVEQIKVEA